MARIAHTRHRYKRPPREKETAKLAAVLAAALLAGSAAAREIPYSSSMDGNRLLELCKANSRDCWNYVNGAADTLTLFTWSALLMGLRLPFVACIPQVPTRQIVEITTRYLQEHPEMRHDNGANLVAFALTEAFPCQTAAQ
jgi:hypothetical protein